MSLLTPLAAYGIRQVLGDGIEHVAAAVVDLFRDHSQTLPRAMQRAHERAWKALEVALAGDGLVDRVKVFFASGDDKGVREQVQAFLRGAGGAFDGTPEQARKVCLDELKRLRRTKVLDQPGLAGDEIARAAGGVQRYADATGLVDGATRAVGQVADALGDYPHLARLLRGPTPGGPPLLAAAFCFFFRREVETDDELAHGLFFDGLRQLTAAQAKAFIELNKAVGTLGDRFDQLFDQLDRVEDEVRQTRSAAEAAHGAVLDVQAELQRLAGLQFGHADDICRLLVAVQQQLDRTGMRQGEVKPQDSFSIRNEDERRAVRVLLDRFRQLPEADRHQLPALLNGLGKLQLGTGDFDAARQTFTEVVATTADTAAKAEAAYNAYRAALEEKKYDDALRAIRQAADLDPARFAPFPLHRYEPKRILGAGGFGTAFLCHDRNFDADVVVKTLHAADLDRGTDELFREARALRRLAHPAVIGVNECDYADSVNKARPYLVMDYFPGDNLEQYLTECGTLPVADVVAIAGQVAAGMRAVHGTGLLHRDLKPANLLVRKDGDGWQVRIIDFGLALRRSTIETSLAARSAGATALGDSVAGTLRYAPPEQMNPSSSVKPGPYSDVYAFGKTCCQALFRTTEPRSRHLATVPGALRDLLERCLEEEIERRPAHFDAVLAALADLDERKQRETEAERRAREEAERQRVTEVRRQEQERERQQHEGASRLADQVREAIERTRGKPTEQDTAAANALIKRYGLDRERAKAIIAAAWEEWNQRPKGLAPGSRPGETTSIDLGGGVTMTFAWIPPGTFLMGSPADEDGREGYEGADETQHRVTLTQGYWLGVHAVTRGQFARFAGASNYVTQAEGEGGAFSWTGSEWKLDPSKNWRNPEFAQTDEHPVVCVSWNDAVAFCEWLNAQHGTKGRFRLPTEAEWEYACRAGTTTPFHFGATISTDQANYDGNYTYGRGKQGMYRQKTTPVGHFPANAWSLYDMHGNVLEWCQDWFGEYPSRDIKDPQGASSGNARVVRGGSWLVGPWHCRAAYRGRSGPGDRYGRCGCRVVLVPWPD
ncbi:MAG: bifunctional serine/threonine-protein kinase/formylglycine-generating enzyme family protein [Gemmataceae bacterium]